MFFEKEKNINSSYQIIKHRSKPRFKIKKTHKYTYTRFKEFPLFTSPTKKKIKNIKRVNYIDTLSFWGS
jgi:hypothetical protein